MKKVVVVGSSGHAKVVMEILAAMNDVEIVGVTSIALGKETLFAGCRVLGDDSVLVPMYESKQFDFLALGVGGYTDNKNRTAIYNELTALGLPFINAIHPSAVISPSVTLGRGIVIFPGAILNTDVQVGDNTIIATGSCIDHETIIGKHVLVSAGVIVGGYTQIADSALLALGSKVVSGIKIGEKALIAAGSVVVKDVPDNAKVFGIPAKPRE
jgi:sugar O-acyltransferase (sialic acid O-acetyltransferase NeuD family)